MALRRGRNIESLLASKLEDDGSRLSDFGEQGRQARVDGRRIREYFVARGKPDDYQYSPSEAREAKNYFKAVDKSKGDWEGTSSPFLQGPSSYDETFKYKDAILGMTPDSETLEEAAIDEASDKEWERYEGINEIDSSGPDIFKQKYSDSETLDDLATDEASALRAGISKVGSSGPNIYNLKARMDSEALDDLAMDEASARTSRIDKISASGPDMYKSKYADSETLSDLAMDEASEEQARKDRIYNISASEPDMYKQRYNTENEGESRYLNKLAREHRENIQNVYGTDAMKKPGTWASEDKDMNALDWMAEENASSAKAERAKRIGMADSGMLGKEEEGDWWDKVKGLFASDEIKSDESLAQETKDNEALAGKIGAASKLYSLLQPEQQQSAPSIPAAKISRGSVAFPGMKLASQKQRRKYFTPKGLMA